MEFLSLTSWNPIMYQTRRQADTYWCPMVIYYCWVSVPIAQWHTITGYLLPFLSDILLLGICSHCSVTYYYWVSAPISQWHTIAGYLLPLLSDILLLGICSHCSVTYYCWVSAPIAQWHTVTGYLFPLLSYILLLGSCSHCSVTYYCWVPDPLARWHVPADTMMELTRPRTLVGLLSVRSLSGAGLASPGLPATVPTIHCHSVGYVEGRGIANTSLTTTLIIGCVALAV